VNEGGGPDPKAPMHLESPLASPLASVPLLQVDGVTLQYKTPHTLVTATYRVDFSVHRSDRYVVLGPSGCGKSTLLKAVGGYIKPTEGRITLDGRAIVRPGPDRVMVFQEFDQLLAWKTVKENVVFALRNGAKLAAAEAEEKALDTIDKVGLGKFADVYPHMLSGGMKARVAIARGMAMEPAILLMDEPFAALDALTRRKMQDELLALWEETRFTVLFVTHSIDEAIRVGSRILLLSPHPGRVKAELACSGCDDVHPLTGASLSDSIHRLLFAQSGLNAETDDGAG
jgi:NitT/TauT family transport system ATP-binding protein